MCVGRNYEEHAKELGNEVPEFPIFFMKPSSNLAFSGAEIEIPPYSDNMHYETELVLLIGKNLKNASETEAEEAIIGYATGLDMTLRDQQDLLKDKGHPWEKAKCFDNAAVVSEFTLKEDLAEKTNSKASENFSGSEGFSGSEDFSGKENRSTQNNLPISLDSRIILHVNGEVKQNGPLRDMIFKPAAIVAHLSKMMTIEEGDLIFTGTPAGVGKVNSGDKLVGQVENLHHVSATIL